MDVTVSKARIEEKPVLRNLLELCMHDYSKFDGREIGEQGLFGYRYLDHYWTEPGRYPFLVRVGGHLAGFVLVREIEPADKLMPAHFIAEFFVLRKHRHKHVGQTAAHRIFDMFPGKWRVSQERDNRPAQAFWRKVISRYTEDRFTEYPGDDLQGPVQEFVTPGWAAAK